MSVVLTALREVWGLFVEDLSFTIALLICFGIATIVLPRVPMPPAWRGATLFLLLAVALVENVRRTAQR